MAQLLWTQRQNIGPTPRFNHALAFDSAHSHVLLFGGATNLTGQELAGDTWQWDGENWTQVDDLGPSARQGLAMAYDRHRNRLVLFGGQTSGGISGETWEWDGQNWTQVAEAGPQARFLHAMAFDSSKNVVTLFGGSPGGDQILIDTWEWNGQDWTQQQDTGPGRSAAAMAYDDKRKRMVLFGGATADTWEWDGTSWTLRTNFGPRGGDGSTLVYNGAVCVLFGGESFQKQTWTWDGNYWTARQDMGPSARFGHGSAFDAGRQRVVLFGGMDNSNNLFGDTWEAW